MKVYNALIGFWVAGALLLPLRAWAGDTTLKLSLADAVSMARQHNSSIKASRSRIEQAEARVVQSRQSLLPKVTVSETLMVTNDPGAALVFKLQQSSIESSDFMPERLNSPKVINDFNTNWLNRTDININDFDAWLNNPSNIGIVADVVSPYDEQFFELKVKELNYFGVFSVSKRGVI